MSDTVAKPKHYTSHPSGVECIQVTEHMTFCAGNAVKYLWRAGLKGNGAEHIRDLRKAAWYCEREAQRLERAAALVTEKTAHVSDEPPDVEKIVDKWPGFTVLGVEFNAGERDGSFVGYVSACGKFTLIYDIEDEVWVEANSDSFEWGAREDALRVRQLELNSGWAESITAFGVRFDLTTTSLGPQGSYAEYESRDVSTDLTITAYGDGTFEVNDCGDDRPTPEEALRAWHYGEDICISENMLFERRQDFDNGSKEWTQVGGNIQVSYEFESGEYSAHDGLLGKETLHQPEPYKWFPSFDDAVRALSSDAEYPGFTVRGIEFNAGKRDGFGFVDYKACDGLCLLLSLSDGTWAMGGRAHTGWYSSRDEAVRLFFVMPPHEAVLPSGQTVGAWVKERKDRSRYDA